MDAKIFVVVPVFNRWVYVESFLNCFRKQTYRNFEMIVVDDGSTDGTSELIREHYQEVQLIRGDGNLWWTGAINVGIRHALAQATDTDAVLAINDDLLVEPDYLYTLNRLFQEMPRTLIGSVAVYIDAPDRIHKGGVKLNMITAKYTVLNQNKKLSDFDEGHIVDVSLLTGRGTLMPVALFHEVGLFDDQHFQQCGDMDLSVRAHHKGYRLIVSYSAIVKSYTESTDSMNISDTYSLNDFKPYFFGIKSNNRLKYHFFFSLNIAKNPFYFVSFLICDLVRVVAHFLLRLRLRSTAPSAS